MKRLSAVILTHNTGAMIEKVIKQLDKVSDEIIVVDDFSIDNTLELVKKNSKKVKILRHRMQNHGAQRNFGYDRATGDWILWLDDDEILNNDLVDEIIKIKELDGYGNDGFELLYKVPVLGNVVIDEWHLRLFRRGKGRNTLHVLHPIVKMTKGSKVKKLKGGYILHLTWHGVESWLNKHIQYSKLDADSYSERQLNVGPLIMIGMFFFVSFKRLKLIKYGVPGIVWAIAASTSWLFKAAYMVEAKRKRASQRVDKSV